MLSAASRAVLSALALTAATLTASAQDFPNRPITIVLPYPPGASTEQVARMNEALMTMHKLDLAALQAAFAGEAA